MATDKSAGEACVYVKASVLRDLERERRGLKWQLSRALKQSDEKAAALSESEAKLKDLLTIVEMNKGVADREMKRSYGRDTELRAAIHEREVLREAWFGQRQRHVEAVVNSLRQRLQRQLQRRVFRSLDRTARNGRQLRLARQRLEQGADQQLLRRSLGHWRCLWQSHQEPSTRSYWSKHTRVMPVSWSQFGATTAAFSVWKAHIEFAKHQRRTTQTAIRWHWLRSLRTIFRFWYAWTRLNTQRRTALRRIMSRKHQRHLQHGFALFRVRCAEASALSWADVLKSAHVAMEEEQKLRAETHAAVTEELHMTYLRFQQREQRFAQLEAHKWQDCKRRELKQLCFATLRQELELRRQKNEIAIRFQWLQHRQRVVRQVFNAWQRRFRRAVQISSMLGAWKARRTHASVLRCLRTLVSTLRLERQQRRKLGALLARRERAWMRPSWLRWRLCVVLGAYEAHAHLALRQFAQRAEAKQLSWHIEKKRLGKITARYQLICGMFMADGREYKSLRLSFRRWANCTSTRRHREQALRGLMRRRRRNILQNALQNWRHRGEQCELRRIQLHGQQVARNRRAIRCALDGWRHHVHWKMHVKLAAYRQLSSFNAWREFSFRRRQQKVKLAHVLQRSIGLTCQRQAFQKWKRDHDEYVRQSQSHQAAEGELLARFWYRWLGFLAHRLRVRRSQQRRVLLQTRKALSNSVLSSVFRSWRQQSRGCRENQRLALRVSQARSNLARTGRTFAYWRQRTATTRQAREVLTRVERRRRLQILRDGWTCWMRRALRTTACLLEASGSRAQHQLVVLVIARRRLETMRRMMKEWRAWSMSAALWRRKRFAFVSQRRHITLQAAFRQWERNKLSHPREIQQRRLNSVLSRHRRAILRQALSFWERWAQREAIFERDKISAELLARSEGRVIALAAEIRVKRVQEFVLDRWKKTTARSKLARQKLHRILVLQCCSTLRISWNSWQTHVRLRRASRRVLHLLNQRIQANAWAKMAQARRCHVERVRGTQRAVLLWHKILQRHFWLHWKCVDVALARAEALAELQSASEASTRTLMESIAAQRHRKCLLDRTFASWKHFAGHHRHIRGWLRNVLQKREANSIQQLFRRWREAAEVQRQRCSELHRLMKRIAIREVREGMERWKRWSLEDRYRRELEHTRQAMIQERESNAKRLAMAQFLAWQRPCMQTTFVRWKTWLQSRRRLNLEQATRSTQYRSHQLVSRVWRCWSGWTRAKKRKVGIVRRLLRGRRLALMATAFARWQHWCLLVESLDHCLWRLERLQQRRQLQRGLRALRQHQQLEFRRQSMIAAAAFAAHSAREREKHAQMQRTAALLLQRQHTAMLCERCFRCWELRVEATRKQKTVVSLAQARSLQRVTRRHFLAWRLGSRRQIVVRQRTILRLSSWNHRRQQRAWQAWLQFLEHAQGLKRLVFDRLVACARRTSLQGAWTRWGAHVKYVNGLAEAQRKARLEALDGKHERLLLHSVQLQQQNRVFRSRHVILAVTKLNQVMKQNLHRRQQRAFVLWEVWAARIHALEHRFVAIPIQTQRLAWLRWCGVTLQQRRVAELERVQSNVVEWAVRGIHVCVTQQRKHRNFVLWQAFTSARRIDRARCRALVRSSQRRRDLNLLQRCWMSWVRLRNMLKLRVVLTSSMQQRRQLQLTQQVYGRWRRWHDDVQRCKLEAVRALAQVYRVWHRRCLLLGWLQWRVGSIEASRTQLEAQSVLAELTQRKTAQCHALTQRLLLVFSNWKLLAVSRQARRNGYTCGQMEIRRWRMLSWCFSYWRNWATSRCQRELLCRSLLRTLRRQHAAVSKRALWRWFLLTQTHSLVVMQWTHRLPLAADVGAHVALVAMAELRRLQLQCTLAQQRSAWKTVDAILRRWRLGRLLTAFRRLARGHSTVRRRRPIVQSASARGFVDRLMILLLRQGFQRWQQRVVALAIQEAELVQQELLRALQAVDAQRRRLQHVGDY